MTEFATDKVDELINTVGARPSLLIRGVGFAGIHAAGGMPDSPRRDRNENDGALQLTTADASFDVDNFLASAGIGRRIVRLKPHQSFFSQGDRADSVFYLQKGRAKLAVVSENGKEATIGLIAEGDFIGEESIASAGLRLATAKSVTACTALKIERSEMTRVMREEYALSDRFLKFLLARTMRSQADLVDQLFNSTEKRLARILLLMAEFATPEEREALIPPITQGSLAEMIGTTRSRVSFFMNRFRKMGFIEYNRRIKVHRSLLGVVLHDDLSKPSGRG